MKNYILVICLAFSSAIFAQSPIEVGQMQFNGGVGFSNYGLPVYVGLDYGIKEDITVGGEFSFRSYSNSNIGTKYRHSIIGISANANYHFNTLLDISSDYDVYAGLNVGFYIWNSSGGYAGNGASGIGVGLQIGGRYYFNESWGVNLEIGGGNAASGGKVGVSYRF